MAKKWDIIISSKSTWFDFKLKELWKYRDLLFLFVKRDFISVYKQTILGPLWFFIQPILTTIMFTIIFGNIGKLGPTGIPNFIFFLAGVTIWNYFAECLTKTSETFVKNQHIFGKVYFPRLIVPLSVVISNLLKFGIQFLLFMIAWTYFVVQDGSTLEPNWTIALLPIYIILMSGLSLGFGIIFSSITTKYKDMMFLLQFGVQLLMFASSVVIPLSTIPPKIQWIFKLNPMVNIIEAFKYGFLGNGEFSVLGLAYSACFMVCLLLVGIMIFNRVEKSFMDTV